jgi:hypothetical protein
MGATVNS